MISQIKQKGFTIVELLIVIVVIAILSALSYVGYTSITARANNSTAAASAKAVKDAANTFQGVHGVYPSTKTMFTSGTTGLAGAEPPVAKLPADITFASGADLAAVQSAVQAQSNPKFIGVVAHGSPITGYTIVQKDFNGSLPITTTILVTAGKATVIAG